MSAITFITFSEFLTAVKAEVAPEGLAENMETPFRSWVAYALADIQTYIPWYRSFNAQFVTKGDVYEFCNASIFQGPRGKITQLFAYKPGVDCAKYHYTRASVAAIDCWMERQRCLCAATEPPSSNIYDSPYCNYVITGEQACDLPYLTSTEEDCAFKRLNERERIFAVGPDYRVYAGPRFPCGYNLLLQWQGINRTWQNGDVVHEDDQLREAVVNYAEHKQFMKENQGAVSEYYSAYTSCLRTLRKRFSDEQSTPAERDCTSAIEQLMATFMPAYPTPVYGPTA